MPLTWSQRLDRLRVRTEELPHWREREIREVTGWTFDGAPIAPGAPWPARDGVHALAATAEVPADWPLEETRLILALGGESLVTLEAGDGATRRYGHDPYHREYRVPGRSLSITAESVARLPFGEPVRAPRLAGARLARIEPALSDLHLMLVQIAETIAVLGDHAVVPHLLGAGERALRGLDWPSATADYIARTAPSEEQQKIWELPELVADPAGLDDAARASVAAARDTLRAELAELARRYPPEGRIRLTGHAHIDLAWLWPYDETRRKARRTFNTALTLLEDSPEFVFNQSTAAYYHQLETDDPELLDRIRDQAKDGRWETIGGMWVEPDTNMPTGESLVRQVLYGQRYFERVFGTRHDTCWLPDCFGFSPALPQILQKGGIENFFTIKVNWSETNKFPHDLFWWEGLDGSRVLAHTFDNTPHGYNGIVQPADTHQTWHNFRGKTQHDETLLAVGYGDGGGGVTPEMIERAAQMQDFPVLPRLEWGRVEDFYGAARAGEPDGGYPVWSGEIYLELHRATLTTQSHVKRLHRRAERALIAAETLGGLVALAGGDVPESLETAWHKVLKNEFHDILPGSGIREINDDAARELAEAVETGQAAQATAMADLVARLPRGELEAALVVANPTDSPRPLLSTLPDGTCIATGDTVPALGVTVIDATAPAAAPGLDVSETHLENAHLRAEIGEDGTITSLVHKPTGRDALEGRGNQLWVYPADKPRSWDAWDIDADYAERGEELVAVESITVTARGPHRAAVRVVKRFRDSTITQVYALAANGRRLDIETEIDWHDRRVLLRTLTPAAIRTRRATFECAHGVVERNTHDNTSWDAAQFEVPAHRFADLSEPDFGLALLNDAKYGHSAKGNVLGLSLVRGPIYPDPMADEGVQHFTYALYPHAGAWHEGGVRQEAEALNQPLVSLPASGLAAATQGFLSLEGVEVALSGLKPAEEGNDLVLRVYEPAGRRGACAVGLPDGWRLGESLTLLEAPDGNAADTPLRPFELRTWRLVRG